MPVRITRGQRAHLDSQSGTVAVALANLEADTAWRERRLVFDSSPLSAAVEEFNLYNDMRLVISGDALGAVEVSGSFYANDPRSFALFLEEAKLAALNVQSDGTIVLRGQ
jgi:transmembrane sensor